MPRETLNLDHEGPHSPKHPKQGLRGCLRVKFHPGMKLVPEWNHPCLWWNVSYCWHVFAEMKLHTGMNSSLSKRQGWNFILEWKKEKKTWKHFILGWKFTMNIFLCNFWYIHSICFPTLTYFNIMKVTRKILWGLFIKNEARKIIITYFLCKIYKRFKFPFIFILIVKFHVSQWRPEIRRLLYIWLQCLVYP